jgi:hypothetical protein
VQRFSVAISGVWDYCLTANGDRATFTELLVTTAAFLLQEPSLSDRPKSTRSCLRHIAHLTGSSLSTFQKSVLLPSSKLELFYVLCVCVGYWDMRSLRWLRYCATSRRSRVRFPMGSFRPHYGTGVDSSSNRNECKGYLMGVA